MYHTLSPDDPLNQFGPVTEKTKDCIGCSKTLSVSLFKRDSSYRDGRRDLCDLCANSPKLSTREHIARQKEINHLASQSQRWDHQDDYRNDVARIGRPMHHTEFFRRLRRIVPDLYVIPGQIKGDFALYQVFGQPQPQFEGRSFNYIGWMKIGTSPEFSQYEFDVERDIPLREKTRGWRTVLLRMIKAGMLTENTCKKVFGEALGHASIVWRRNLFVHRNGHE